jgi:hypothetical protein
MSTLAVELHPQAHNVKCTDVAIFVELLDGRTISAPLVGTTKLMLSVHYKKSFVKCA